MGGCVCSGPWHEVCTHSKYSQDKGRAQDLRIDDEKLGGYALPSTGEVLSANDKPPAFCMNPIFIRVLFLQNLPIKQGCQLWTFMPLARPMITSNPCTFAPGLNWKPLISSRLAAVGIRGMTWGCGKKQIRNPPPNSLVEFRSGLKNHFILLTLLSELMNSNQYPKYGTGLELQNHTCLEGQLAALASGKAMREFRVRMWQMKKLFLPDLLVDKQGCKMFSLDV